MEIELAEVIRQLRHDLAAAAAEGQGQEPRFEIGPIELEFAVVIDSSKQGGVKGRLWVVDAGYDQRKSSSSTHRIKLTLQPRDPGDPARNLQVTGPMEHDED